MTPETTPILASGVVVEIIKVVGAIVSAAIVPWMAFRLRRIEENAAKIEKNTNSLVDKLIKKTEASSEQVGKEKEQVAQAGRDA